MMFPKRSCPWISSLRTTAAAGALAATLPGISRAQTPARTAPCARADRCPDSSFFYSGLANVAVQPRAGGGQQVTVTVRVANLARRPLAFEYYGGAIGDDSRTVYTAPAAPGLHGIGMVRGDGAPLTVAPGEVREFSVDFVARDSSPRAPGSRFRGGIALAPVFEAAGRWVNRAPTVIRFADRPAGAQPAVDREIAAARAVRAQCGNDMNCILIAFHAATDSTRRVSMQTQPAPSQAAPVRTIQAQSSSIAPGQVQPAPAQGQPAPTQSPQRKSRAQRTRVAADAVPLAPGAGTAPGVGVAPSTGVAASAGVAPGAGDTTLGNAGLAGMAGTLGGLPGATFSSMRGAAGSAAGDVASTTASTAMDVATSTADSLSGAAKNRLDSAKARTDSAVNKWGAKAKDKTAKAIGALFGHKH